MHQLKRISQPCSILIKDNIVNDTKVLHLKNNNSRLLIDEAVMIKLKYPSLNRQDSGSTRILRLYAEGYSAEAFPQTLFKLTLVTRCRFWRVSYRHQCYSVLPCGVTRCYPAVLLDVTLQRQRHDSCDTLTNPTKKVGLPRSDRRSYLACVGL